MKQYACVRRLPWEHFQISTFCVVIARSFPFLPLLRRYAFLLRKTWESTTTVKGLCLQRTADAGVIMSKIIHSRKYFRCAHYNSGQPRYKKILKVTTLLTFTSILKQTLTVNGDFLHSELYANNTNDPGLVDTRRPFQQDCPPSLLETSN